MKRFEQMLKLATGAAAPQCDARPEVLRRIRQIRYEKTRSSGARKGFYWFAGGSVGVACLGLAMLMMSGQSSQQGCWNVMISLLQPDTLRWVW